ncbi:MAG TPA: lamin tail domain-containing protein, partial [Polyangia bacterium]|nr:lamin tail domain-containing protein [Polyangia bacterium]
MIWRPACSIALLGMSVWLAGCGTQARQRDDGQAPDGTADDTTGDTSIDGLPTSALRINELLADDVNGTTIDEDGQLEDWIELVNTGASALALDGFTLAKNDGLPQALPAVTLASGETLLFYADNDLQQGDRHLRFKLDAAGERVVLRDVAGRVVDDVTFPALGPNQSYARFPDGGAWRVCRYASPGRRNGDRCGPAPPPELPDEQHFRPYTWPPQPGPPAPLAITEVALFPARFVEVKNTSASAVTLADFTLRVAAFSPAQAIPGPGQGSPLSWPQAVVGPGARVVVAVPPDAAGLPDAAGEREGAVTLFAGDGAVVDRADFMRWPTDAVLSRAPDGGSRLQFCANPTPGTAAAACDELPVRPAGDRFHSLYTPADFETLAAGSTELESRSVKFVVDMDSGDVVHFLGTKAWALHYTFIRERIYQEARVDRCDPQQAAVFNQGWVDFSVREYFQTDRRFLLGTAVYWGGSRISTIEFAQGDVITGEQMRRAFFAVTARLPDPTAWTIRPTGNDQVVRVRDVEGTVPIADRNLPFRGRTFQPLVAGPAFGLLRFVAGADLEEASLGAGVILITDEVPNDIPLVGGLITEAFQTPLAHVAVLAKNRGTPDMALTAARQDARIAPFIDQLVRLEVTGGGFMLREATADEVRAHLEKLFPRGELRRPRLDTTVRGPVDLGGRALDDLPVIGGKASQLAELKILAN